MARLLALVLVIASVRAAPTITFPINSQVPPVARVSEPFNFQFSPSTFTSSASNISYSLTNAPPWLRLDSGSRTFSGTPKAQDVGSVTINLTGTDTSGSVELTTTFMVSPDPAPNLGQPIEKQLSAFGNASGPTTLSLYPSSPFGFAFSSSTFIKTGKDLLYYAISEDNTPLPSWIHFDAAILGFSGNTPQLTSLTASPQIFGIQLIASDVAGFSGVVTSFQMVVGSHELIFANDQQILNATKGVALQFTALRDELNLDGNKIKDNELHEARAQVPSWLMFDDKTFALTGTPAQDASSQDISIFAKDVYGDVANTTIRLNIQSALFTGPVGDVQAAIGTILNYTLPQSLLTEPNVSLKADLGAMTSWLAFDPVKLNFYGTVPHDARPANSTVSLDASSAQVHDFQAFQIHILEPSGVETNTNSTTSDATRTSTSLNSPQSTTISSSRGISKRKVVAIAVAVPIVLSVVSALFLALCMLNHRKRWGRRLIRPTKDIISGPLPQGVEPVQEETIIREDVPEPEREQEHSSVRAPAPEQLLPPIIESADDRPTPELSWSAACYKILKLPRPQSRELPTSNNGLAALDTLEVRTTAPQRMSLPLRYMTDYSQRRVSTLAEPSEVYSSKRDSRRYSRRSVGLPVGRRGGGMGHGVNIDKNRSYDTGDSLGRYLGSLRSSGFETMASGETQSTEAPDLTKFPPVPLSSAVMTAQPTKRGSIRMVTPYGMAVSPEIASDPDRTRSPDPSSQPNDLDHSTSEAASKPKDTDQERHGVYRQISPDRRSLYTKRNSYIRKRPRIQSRFFAAGSSRASSQMQPLETQPSVESTPISHMKAQPLDILRTETQRSIECSSKYSNDEPDPADTEKSLTKILNNGLESLRHIQTNSSMAESHRYDSASSVPQSCKSQEAPSILLVRSKNGRSTWYQKVPNAGGESSEEMANHEREVEPPMEDLRVSRAISTRPAHVRRHSNMQTIRSPLASVSNGTFRLIDSKGKRPVSVGSPQAGKGKFGSQRGEVGAFL
ncbi:MAG: hypothetical protein M1836_001587 [Candelina mexicana]|nr:MAG: hypothetical protein M1836_001587 [Candelina mexicana]